MKLSRLFPFSNDHYDFVDSKSLWVSFGLVTIFLIWVSKSDLTYLKRFSELFSDTKFYVREMAGQSPTVNKDLVLIKIDEKSINAYGRWPWSREVMADLISTFSEAKIVALDIVFSESTNPALDQKLSNQIGLQQNVLLGFFLRQFGTQSHSEQAQFLLNSCAYQNLRASTSEIGIREFSHAELNIQSLLGNAMDCAIFSTEPDLDGIFRHYSLGYLYNGHVYPTLAMQVAKWWYGKHPEVTVTDSGFETLEIGPVIFTSQNFFKVDFPTLDDLEASTVSASDVLGSNSTNKSLFKDKVILIGVTELGVYDMRPTPIDPVMPGVMLHFSAINSLINNNFITNHPVIELVLFLIVPFFIFFINGAKSGFRRANYYLGLILAVLVICYGLFIYFSIWLKEFLYLLQIILLASIFEANRFKAAALYAGNLKSAFSSYVSPYLVEQIGHNTEELALGGEEKYITVVFCDLRGFTKICEGRSPKDVVSILNKVFEPLTHSILDNQGTLDKYMGDAIMGFYNAPLEIKAHQFKAVSSAINMLQELEKVNRDNELDLKIGIGINSGDAIVGNMGSSVRFSYTAIGDAVNLASRIESLTKHYGVSLIISESVYDGLTETSKKEFRLIDQIVVQGRSEINKIYTQSLSDYSQQHTFDQGLSFYLGGDFEAALPQFNKLVEDPVSQVLSNRIKSNLVDSATWKGAFEFIQK